MDTTKIPEGYKPGLEGVIAGLSDIAEVNPDRDALIYRGYFAHELSEKGTYTETSYLLLHGKLPTKSELKKFGEDLTKDRSIPRHVLEVMKKFPANSHPMVGLQAAVALVHMTDPDAASNAPEANLAKSKRLIAQTPTIVAALSRIHRGQEVIAPNPELSHATNFLTMVTGKEPDPELGKVFDSTMTLYAEHGFNASTFAGLVVSSTLSDIYSSVVAAIGALKGPLHGGANEGAINMLLKVGDVAQAESFIKEALAKKEKIMGFGHRVYKKQDSRAPYMKKMAEYVANKVGDKKWYPLAAKIDDIMRAEKNLFPNVDFYASVVYYLMGLPIEIDTPIFAMARMAGWTAHINEQLANNKLIRPKCIYTGPADLPYVPIDQR